MSRRLLPLRRLAVLAAALTAASALAACGGSQGGAADAGSSHYTLRVGYISPNSTPTGPEGWAQSKGTLIDSLRPAGVDNVTWAPFPNGPDLNQALAGGSLDIGLFGDTPAIVAHAAGQKTRVINQQRIDMDIWLVGAKGGPTRIADLRGRTVATQVGSYMYRYLVEVLNEAGLSDSVKISNIYTPDAANALASGQIAAYAAPDTSGPLLAAKGYPVIDKASVDHPDLRGTSVTVITEAAADAHPTLVQAWNSARADAITAANANQGDFYAYQSKATGVPADQYPALDPLSHYPTDPFTAEGLKLITATKTFLVQQKLAKNDFDFDSWRLPPGDGPVGLNAQPTGVASRPPTTSGQPTSSGATP